MFANISRNFLKLIQKLTCLTHGNIPQMLYHLKIIELSLCVETTPQNQDEGEVNLTSTGPTGFMQVLGWEFMIILRVHCKIAKRMGSETD